MTLTPSDLAPQRKEVVDVFLDYENVRRTARAVFCGEYAAPHEGVVDPISLAEKIVAKRQRPSVLRTVHVFRGRPNSHRQPKPAAAFGRLNARWSASPKLETHYRDLKYTDTGFETFFATEKGVDVDLAVCMISTALADTGRPNAMILMSNDTDLEPVVMYVMNETDTHIEIATWDGRESNPLYIREYLKEVPPRRLPYCHFMDESCFDAVCQDHLLADG